MAQSKLDLGDIASRAPTLGNERLAADIVVEQVQRFIDQLLLRYYVLPTCKILPDSLELRSPVSASVIKHDLEVLKAAGDLAH